MNYSQITMDTALLTTHFRLRSIDSESHSLSSESKANLKARPPGPWPGPGSAAVALSIQTNMSESFSKPMKETRICYCFSYI